MTETITLDITGMTCDHCVHAVTTALEGVEGVKRASVSLEEKKASVEADPVDIAALIAAVEEEGYEATVR